MDKLKSEVKERVITFLLMNDPVLTCIRDHPSELRHSPNFSLLDLEEVHMQERGHMQNGKVYLSVARRKKRSFSYVH